MVTAVGRDGEAGGWAPRPGTPLTPVTNCQREGLAMPVRYAVSVALSSEEREVESHGGAPPRAGIEAEVAVAAGGTEVPNRTARAGG